MTPHGARRTAAAPMAWHRKLGGVPAAPAGPTLILRDEA